MREVARSSGNAPLAIAPPATQRPGVSRKRDEGLTFTASTAAPECSSGRCLGVGPGSAALSVQLLGSQVMFGLRAQTGSTAGQCGEAWMAAAHVAQVDRRGRSAGEDGHERTSVACAHRHTATPPRRNNWRPLRPTATTGRVAVWRSLNEIKPSRSRMWRSPPVRGGGLPPASSRPHAEVP